MILEHVLSFTAENGFEITVAAVDRGDGPTDFGIEIRAIDPTDSLRPGSGLKTFGLDELKIVANYLSRRGDLDTLYLAKVEEYTSHLTTAFETLIVDFRTPDPGPVGTMVEPPKST